VLDVEPCFALEAVAPLEANVTGAVQILLAGLTSGTRPVGAALGRIGAGVGGVARPISPIVFLLLTLLGQV
jgi:hypothetical protein